MIEHNVDVRVSRTVEFKRLDEDFFTEEERLRRRRAGRRTLKLSPGKRCGDNRTPNVRSGGEGLHNLPPAIGPLPAGHAAPGSSRTRPPCRPTRAARPAPDEPQPAALPPPTNSHQRRTRADPPPPAAGQPALLPTSPTGSPCKPHPPPGGRATATQPPAQITGASAATTTGDYPPATSPLPPPFRGRSGRATPPASRAGTRPCSCALRPVSLCPRHDCPRQEEHKASSPPESLCSAEQNSPLTPTEVRGLACSRPRRAPGSRIARRRCSPALDECERVESASTTRSDPASDSRPDRHRPGPHRDRAPPRSGCIEQPLPQVGKAQADPTRFLCCLCCAFPPRHTETGSFIFRNRRLGPRHRSTRQLLQPGRSKGL